MLVRKTSSEDVGPQGKCGYGTHVRNADTEQLKMSSEGYPDADADAVPKPCEVRN